MTVPMTRGRNRGRVVNALWDAWDGIERQVGLRLVRVTSLESEELRIFHEGMKTERLDPGRTEINTEPLDVRGYSVFARVARRFVITSKRASERERNAFELGRDFESSQLISKSTRERYPKIADALDAGDFDEVERLYRSGYTKQPAAT